MEVTPADRAAASSRTAGKGAFHPGEALWLGRIVGAYEEGAPTGEAHAAETAAIRRRAAYDLARGA